ncbi:hypothetical protein, unlikely [Trypanosoma brucei gambiense DAL972]|uniref:T. brucei spp.-specific protein n=1 Tax=Trypanosoma brucei gambiense (strain MHOM/CI/86/DAL972) TaxID=679716 RepID=C9ZTR2_TRYB9|nr:hypothetical protein, unlikely [Trypanosoma brucei gambiense DAL972]CBH12797.1 hypothetical protein, unlikely [Trypanosoma brucei gambiense DAL972]|eukprot:XP_011775077.1 hypothetical protein, unlikely [Trypanosoma brucei gambiense DAL972]
MTVVIGLFFFVLFSPSVLQLDFSCCSLHLHYFSFVLLLLTSFILCVTGAPLSVQHNKRMKFISPAVVWTILWGCFFACLVLCSYIFICQQSCHIINFVEFTLERALYPFASLCCTSFSIVIAYQLI